MLRFHRNIPLLFVALVLAACSDHPWNNPYPARDFEKNTLYSSFSERPKHLDPARSYSSNEYAIIGQIYEPPLQYHYLRRPYVLEPMTVEAVPMPEYYDADGRRLPADAAVADIARSVYEIRIRPGIRFQPHPAFAQNAQGAFLYHALTPKALGRVYTLADFEARDSRELTAADYLYQIKRLARPGVHSPILGVMNEHIVGLEAYSHELKVALAELEKEQGEGAWLDLRKLPLKGVKQVDRYTYRVTIKGKYPQFLYWLAMPFFSPMPFEAERFYAQPGLQEKNITLNWYPVGTGAYMLSVNNPNKQMVLDRNPEYHGAGYPESGDPGDREAGLLDDAGRPLPFIDRVVYSLEKESIPYWNKFLQGYYDASGISSDSFDQAIAIGAEGEAGLTDSMIERGIQLKTGTSTSTFYFGFNMLDPVVGGLDEKKRKLRQAIAIAVDYEEYVSIFLNGRGIPAQGPVPPGIFGYLEGEEGINPTVYDWVNGRPKRKSIEDAKQLLQEAGYPDGREPKTGSPLLLYFDTTGSGPDAKARLNWWRKQFRKLKIQLVIRNTDYNRFQEKMLKGTAQLYQWGWNADYPDPENFMFLLYGPNAKKEKNGENASNYKNSEYDALFEQMKNMDNGPQRQEIVDRMNDIVRRDTPWLWGLHPKDFSLHHSWYKNIKPNLMAHNNLSYRKLDVAERAARRTEWNQPVLWPFIVVFLSLLALTIPAVLSFWRHEHAAPRLEESP